MEEDKENISLSLSIGTSHHQPHKNTNENKNNVQQQQLHVLFPTSTAPEDGDIVPRKKLRLSKEQSDMLENSFRENKILNGNQKQELARMLDLQVRQVEVWFQNRRARTKLKKTEVECEFFRRYCQSLSEENKRLKKELHALKLVRPSSPSVFLQISKQTKISAEGDGKSSASSDSMSDKSRIYNCS